MLMPWHHRSHVPVLTVSVQGPIGLALAGGSEARLRGDGSSLCPSPMASLDDSSSRSWQGHLSARARCLHVRSSRPHAQQLWLRWISPVLSCPRSRLPTLFRILGLPRLTMRSAWACLVSCRGVSLVKSHAVHVFPVSCNNVQHGTLTEIRVDNRNTTDTPVEACTACYSTRHTRRARTHRHAPRQGSRSATAQPRVQKCQSATSTAASRPPAASPAPLVGRQAHLRAAAGARPGVDQRRRPSAHALRTRRTQLSCSPQHAQSMPR